MIHSRRETCRLCDSKNVKKVIHLEPTPLADLYLDQHRKNESTDCFPLELYFCEDCYHVQLLDVISPEYLFEDYLYETVSSPGLVQHFEQYAQATAEKLSVGKEDQVLDIGSNDGTLLSFFKQYGCRVLGVDAAKEIANRATKNGIETISGFFNRSLAEQIKRNQGPMDLITANNVYAHADDLAGITQGIQLLLNPEGVFVFEVSYLPDLIENSVFDFVYHEHLCYHSVISLDRFFKRHGLVLFDVHRVPTKGGSIRGYARLASGERPITSNVKGFLDQELKQKLDTSEPYSLFESRINQIRQQLAPIVDKAEKEGKVIYGYGACATATTMIYHFNLTTVLSGIVDDNPDRQNLFSPGCHIPIISPDKIYSDRPDYILITAWRFAEDIIKKHAAYLENGGQFIVPLPEIRIIGSR